MELDFGIGVLRKPIEYSVNLVEKQGSWTQIYGNSDGSYTPDRTVASNYLIVAPDVVITNPNKAQGSQVSKGDVTSVVWYYQTRQMKERTRITSSDGRFAINNDNTLSVKFNMPDSDTGSMIIADITFTNPVTNSSITVTKSHALITNINTVNSLSLVPEPGNVLGAVYVGDNYVLNPITTPLNTDGTNWKRHLRCQLYDGKTALKKAYDGSNRNGNAFYFWYLKDRKGNLSRITSNTEWFSGTVHPDGTWDNDVVVDLSKMYNATVVCRAGYIPYGEMSGYKDADGTISPGKCLFGFLEYTFRLSVASVIITKSEVVAIANRQVELAAFDKGNDPSTVPIVRRLEITAGGTVLNYTPNPLPNDDRNLADVLFIVNWYKVEDNGTRTLLQAGSETLTTNLKALGATSPDKLPKMKCTVEPRVPDLWGNNYVVGYIPDGDDPQPLANEIHGNPEFLKRLEFMLFDTTTEDDSGTFAASILQRNNLFHYRSGDYAPTVGITAAQEAECTSNDLYTDSACKNLAYANGKYDAISEWEKTDKPLMAAGGKPRTLYKKDSKGTISAVSHKLRPWETTETKYSIGLGYEFPVYLLDQVKGKSGKVWKGIFTDVTEWDGIDLTPYRLDPTAWGPGAFCTVGGKARNFFYLYKGEANCQSSCGSTDPEWSPANLPSITPFLTDRTYPRHSTSQIDAMNMSRANNKDASSPYPMSEGGFFALDVVTTAVELMSLTKYLDNPELYGSGISSNDGVNADNFFKVGGVKFKKASDSAYSYATWGAGHKINVDGKSASPNWSNFASAYASKEQCMESQMAASMAAELGIKPSTSAADMHYFYMYGEKYYYMSVGSVTSLADGQMNARVYKAVDYTYTDGTDGQVTCEFLLRMSLYSGAMLSGDVLVYNGGGAELVAKAVNTTGGGYGNPVGFWMEPSQRKWKKITSVTIGETEKFGFEDSYKNIIPLDGNTVTVTNNWRRNRVSYTPFATINSSRGRGDCLFTWDENWYNTSSANANKKSRLALRFGLAAHYGLCAPRSLNCCNACDAATRATAGRAQALVRIAQ